MFSLPSAPSGHVLGVASSGLVNLCNLTYLPNGDAATVGQVVVPRRERDALPFVVDDIRLLTFCEIFAVGVDDCPVFKDRLCQIYARLFAHGEVDIEAVEYFLDSFLDCHGLPVFYINISTPHS